jgi:NADP-dependent 3-hydroxy acid dehydrogenase YdfG
MSMAAMRRLDGRVAVITGAATGIGLALARRFDAEGMHRALADVEEDVLKAAVDGLRRSGAVAVGVRADAPG